MTDQERSIYGLIGYPITHSLSPLMHNMAFQELGMDAEYKIFSFKEEKLTHFFKELREKECNIYGLNVTVPYKERVFPFLDSLSPYARKAKAVNTIVIHPSRKMSGFNTDGSGFLAHLTEMGFKSHGKKIAILGAGGAVRAILTVFCLLPERPQWIKIYNIHQERANDLIADLQIRMDVNIVEAVGSIDDLDIPKADLLINATPLGMEEDDPCLVEEDLLHPKLLVYDLIYHLTETRLMKMAKQKGAKVTNGLGMLFYQGVLAFQHWTSIELDVTIKKKIREALTKALKS